MFETPDRVKPVSPKKLTTARSWIHTAESVETFICSCGAKKKQKQDFQASLLRCLKFQLEFIWTFKELL